MSTEAVEILGRKYSVDILRAAREPRSVSWLSQELDIPIATCYRRVKELSENMYLEEVAADEGRDRTQYCRTTDSIEINLASDVLLSQQTPDYPSGTDATTPTAEAPTVPDTTSAGVSGSDDGQFTLCGPMSAVDPTVSVVIPTLNEEESIEEVLQAVFTALRELGLPSEIVVADSSTDRTPDIARDHGAIVTEPERKGYGAAYLDGFDTARGDTIVMGDADTTYDFTELPKLIRTMQETDADMVIGSRLDGEILPGAMPPLHQCVGNPMLTRMLNTLFDAESWDTHSGFRVFTREVLDAMSHLARVGTR